MNSRFSIRVQFCVVFFLFITGGCHTRQPEHTSVEARPARSIPISCEGGFIGNDKEAYIEGGGAGFEKTIENNLPSEQAPEGMVLIPGGSFSMGGVNPVKMSNGGHEEMNDARPIHRVQIDPFFMDITEVTNEQFARFVKATGYVTLAEKKPTKEEFPEVPKENLVAGSVVFTPPLTEVDLNDYHQWWSYVPGADWRHPTGDKLISEKDLNLPVVQVAWEDAVAYANWAGKRLPTEAEWEFAARGGQTGNVYAWGNSFKRGNQFMANSFQGKFPYLNTAEDGFAGVAPVKSYDSNRYGLYDISGNVWEWCSDWYGHDYYARNDSKKILINPKGPEVSSDPSEPGVKKKVQRGGSFLCTDQYCTRYMVGTRGKGDWRSPTNHLGFRCVKDIKKKE